jgi:hypothetical protein
MFLRKLENIQTKNAYFTSKNELPQQNDAQKYQDGKNIN